MLTFSAIISAIAILFGIIWLGINVYYQYPIHTRLINRAITGEDIFVEAGDALPEEELPTIDVLLPAYKEDTVIRNSIESIRSANYPQSLIQLIVLVEPDDDKTRAVLDDIREETDFQIVEVGSGNMSEVVIPDLYPGDPNKPRALNYGFKESYGDIVGVLDAEDIIDPDLFLSVAGAIEAEGYDYAQGLLDMANEDDGWINAMFRGEYGLWYRLMIPGFKQVDYPVPLGGTTNFYRREVLEEISDIRLERYGPKWDPEAEDYNDLGSAIGPIPWDPTNVTEDFELGLMLWIEGYQLAVVNRITIEESPLGIREWIRQRTRWQKGKLFTFHQYYRHPPADPRERFHILMQSIVPHLGPINITGITLISVLGHLILDVSVSVFAEIALLVAFVFVIQHMIIQSMGYYVASDSPLHIRIPRLITNLITLPIYWVLVWIADVRGLYQFYRNETDWEKTPHHGRHYRLRN